MNLDPRVRAELERRGVSNVRVLLQNPDSAGVGRQAIVRLGTSGLDPARGDVEDWLLEKDTAAEQIAGHRHQEQLRVASEGAKWARRATWAAILVGAASVLATAIFGILALKHG